MIEAAIERAFTSGLEFLLKEGYHFEGMTITESKASGKFYSFKFKSEVARRGFSVTFFQQSDSIHSSIDDLDNDFTFSDSGAMKVEAARFKDIEGDFESRVATYLDGLKDEVLAKHIEVLRGAAFKNDAFDWSPYK